MKNFNPKFLPQEKLDNAARTFKEACNQVIARDKKSGSFHAAVLHFRSGKLTMWDYYEPVTYEKEEVKELFDLIDYNDWSV